MRYIKVKKLTVEVANNFVEDTNPIILVTITNQGFFGKEVETHEGNIRPDFGGYKIYIKKPGTDHFYRCYSGYNREANKYTNYTYTLKHFLSMFNKGENFCNALVVTDIADFNC